MPIAETVRIFHSKPLPLSIVDVRERHTLFFGLPDVQFTRANKHGNWFATLIPLAVVHLRWRPSRFRKQFGQRKRLYG